MTGEVITGKRTFIVPNGAPAFELPQQHRLKLVHGFREYVELSVVLGDNSLYVLERIEEEDDCVTLYLGDETASIGPATFIGDTEPLPPVRGYQFPPE